MLQRGACVCAVVKQRSSRVPHPAICSRKSGRHCAHKRRASKICWITAAHGNGGAGQEEYSIQADQGRQGQRSEFHSLISPHYIIPFIPLPHCHALLPSSIPWSYTATHPLLLSSQFSNHPSTYPYKPSPVHAITASPFPVPPPTPPHSSPLCLCRELQEPDAEKQVQSQVTALQQNLQSAMMAGMVATSLHTLNTIKCASCCMCTVCHNITLTSHSMQWSLCAV